MRKIINGKCYDIDTADAFLTTATRKLICAAGSPVLIECLYLTPDGHWFRHRLHPAGGSPEEEILPLSWSTARDLLSPWPGFVALMEERFLETLGRSTPDTSGGRAA